MNFFKASTNGSPKFLLEALNCSKSIVFYYSTNVLLSNYWEFNILSIWLRPTIQRYFEFNVEVTRTKGHFASPLSLFDFFLYQRTKFVQKQHHRTPARLVWAPQLRMRCYQRKIWIYRKTFQETGVDPTHFLLFLQLILWSLFPEKKYFRLFTFPYITVGERIIEVQKNGEKAEVKHKRQLNLSGGPF